jgi:hypothetical protein
MRLGVISLIISLSDLGLFAVRAFAQEENHDPHPWTDPITSCQYLVTPEGGIAPRMVDNGAIYIHMGCIPTADAKKPFK